MSRLREARVAVFGVGGVGGHCVQALARAGIGAIDVFDDDVVSVTNINRQAVAMTSTLGRPKVEVIRDQILDINPMAVVTCRRMFYMPENADEVDLSVYDYIVDAIDTVKAKVELICRANAAGVPIISATPTSACTCWLPASGGLPWTSPCRTKRSIASPRFGR